MLNRYNDLINSPSKESIYLDESSLGTSIETSMESDSYSHSDFYSTFMSNYRKKIKLLMSSSPLDDSSSKSVVESNLDSNDFNNYDSNSASFLYSKPANNQSYHISRVKRNINNDFNLNRTTSPTSHKFKTKINFNNNKKDIHHHSKKVSSNDNDIRAYLPPTKRNHIQRHGERKRRRKMKDFLTFDPVFNKYFYSRDKIDSSDTEEYYEYYDEYNEKEVNENKVENELDDDIIDSNSMVREETDYDYDDDLMWVETGKIDSKNRKNHHKKANIWQPSLASPTIRNLNNQSKTKKKQK